MKPWTEARNNTYIEYHSKLTNLPTYQRSFWNVSRKVNYHTIGKWFIHGPKRRNDKKWTPNRTQDKIITNSDQFERFNLLAITKILL